MVWARTSGSVKGNLNTEAYNDILDLIFLTLWQQFGEGPFLFQHYNTLTPKRGPQRNGFLLGLEE